MSNEKAAPIPEGITAEFGAHSCKVCGTDCAEAESQIATLTAEVAALKAEIARRDAPVTDAEWIEHSRPRRVGYGYLPKAPTVREILDSLILARATPPQDGGKE